MDRVGAVGLVLVDQIVHVSAIRCLECLLTYFSCISSPRMAAPQLAQQQMQQHRMSWRVARTTTARHQPLTAWPPIQARNRPVAIQYTSATRLQMLARHSTSANSAPQMPPAAPAASASFVSPCSASTAAAPAPAAPKPAQQHAKIQLRTITPPNSPHTTGSAVCGLLLPTTSTRGPFTLGRGASGTLGKLRATLEAAWAPPPPSWEAAWEPPPATLYASFSASPTLSDTVTSGAASRLREIFASVTERARMKTRAQRVATPDISANADCNT